MYEAIVFHFVGGDALFSGASLLLIAVALVSSSRKQGLRVVAGILALSGVTFVILSATPAPIWLLAAWLVATVAWLAQEPSRSHTVRKTRPAARSAAAIATLAIATSEIPHLWTPLVSCDPATRVYVIGDSISAGIGASRDATWPAQLARDSGLEVVNLAQAGATALTARQQAENIPPDAALVILEIGGNDMLNDHDARAFRADLEQLLAEVARPGRTVVMFELPLLPTLNAFGRVQRDLASKYGVILIPKRRFARILTSGGATLDGLHLSPCGHEEMAVLVQRVLGY